MPTCQELSEIVSDYVEGRMPLWQRLRVQVHLGTCSRCRAYLRQLKMTVQTLGKMPDESIPEDVRGELMERFRGLRRKDGTRE